MGKKLAIGALLFVLVASSVGSLANTALNFKDRMSPAPAQAADSVSDAIKTLGENDQKLVVGQQGLTEAISVAQTSFNAVRVEDAAAISQTVGSIWAGLSQVAERLAALETSAVITNTGGTGWTNPFAGLGGGSSSTDGNTNSGSGKTVTIPVPKAPPAPQTDSLGQIRSKIVAWWHDAWYTTQAGDWTTVQLPEETEFSNWVADIGSRVVALGEEAEANPEYRFANALFDLAQALETPDWTTAEQHAQKAVSTGVLGPRDPSPLDIVRRLRAVQDACVAVAKDFDGLDCRDYRECHEVGEVYRCIVTTAGVGGTDEPTEVVNTSLEIQIRSAIESAGFLTDPVSLGIILDGLATGKWATVAEAVTAWFTGDPAPDPVFEDPPEWTQACETLRGRLDCEEYLECKRVPADRTLCIIGRHLGFEMTERGEIANPADRQATEIWLNKSP